jgi:hypothetical protein
MTDSLSKKYNDLCNASSDINEHLPTLYKYAQQCKHITEMGVRTIVSTYALMAGAPDHLVSIDINHPDDSSNTPGKLQEAQTVAAENNIDFQFVQGSTLEISIEQTDLLFIDTWHTYSQLKQELSKHHQNVNKYIILHDTYTYRNSDEGGGGIGLMPAVNEFLDNNANWLVYEQFSNNNGLTILAKQ